MAANPERRNQLLDAAIQVLATKGSRGLTHRAVDEAGGFPKGTCGNYFPNRNGLLAAMGERAFQRLIPSPDERAAQAAYPPSMERWVELMNQLVERSLAKPSLPLALLELRLLASRHPAVGNALTKTFQASLAIDLDVHRAAKLPGGQREIVLLHIALDGLLLNLLTLPEALPISTAAERQSAVRDLVERLLAPFGPG